MSAPRSYYGIGLSAAVFLRWPASNIGTGADYSVDFSGSLCGGDRIVQAAFSVGAAGTVAWQSIFGSVATAWIAWTTTGQLQQIGVTALTANGDALQALVFINVGSVAPSLTAPTPEFAPNAFICGDAYFPDASGNPLILG